MARCSMQRPYFQAIPWKSPAHQTSIRAAVFAEHAAVPSLLEPLTRSKSTLAALTTPTCSNRNTNAGQSAVKQAFPPFPAFFSTSATARNRPEPRRLRASYLRHLRILRLLGEPLVPFLVPKTAFRPDHGSLDRLCAVPPRGSGCGAFFIFSTRSIALSRVRR